LKKLRAGAPTSCKRHPFGIHSSPTSPGFAALGRVFRPISIFSNRAVAARKPYRHTSDGFVTLTGG